MNEFRSQRPQPRPAGIEQQAQSQTQQPQRQYAQPVQKTRSRKPIWVVVSLIVIALVVAGAFWWFSRDEGTVTGQINQDKYQAVFFTNGQVYFGKLSSIGDEYFKLQDVYYLQADSEESKNPQDTTKKQAGDVQLIKLGSEIHGPDDEMTISESQILFFENIKDDGDVGKSISEYRKNQ